MHFKALTVFSAFYELILLWSCAGSLQGGRAHSPLMSPEPRALRAPSPAQWCRGVVREHEWRHLSRSLLILFASAIELVVTESVKKLRSTHRNRILTMNLNQDYKWKSLTQS